MYNKFINNLEMSKEKKLKILKLCGIIVYIIAIVIAESFYRNPLFNYSLEFQQDFQENSPPSAKYFFLVLTEFGTMPALLPITIFFILFTPLNLAFLLVSLMGFCSYTNNLLKLIYSNPRPFWINEKIKIDCNTSYGNPSGHSLDSVAIYLGLWHIIVYKINWFKNKVILQILLLVAFIGLIITIILSRLYLGVHSINQVIYGSSLGLVMYYIFFHFFKLQDWDEKDFFNFFKEKKYILAVSVCYLCLFLLALFVFLFKNYDEYNKPHIEKLNKLCDEKSEVNLFQNDGFKGSLIIFITFGTYYGLVFITHWAEKQQQNYPNQTISVTPQNSLYYENQQNSQHIFYYEKLMNWYKGNFCSQIKRLLICISCGIPLLLYVLIPSNSHLAIVYIFKNIIPLGIGIFFIFSFATMYQYKVTLNGNSKQIDSFKNVQIKKNNS
jgi:membrane-associated phospholipid phosphatase